MFTHSAELVALVVVIIFCIIGYLLGSISFAVIFSKLFTGKDVREQGSGNAGMTNVMRNSGKLPGILTFVCDFLKGTFSVLIAMNFFIPLCEYIYCFGYEGPIFVSPAVLYFSNIVNPRIVGYIVAIFCMLGHMFPIFFKFRGGKGVATIVGVAAAFNPLTALVCFLFFLVVVLIKKYVSLASILAVTLAVPMNAVFYYLFYTGGTFAWFGGYEILVSTILVAIMSTLVIARHHENIGRLIKGTERKIGDKKKG